MSADSYIIKVICLDDNEVSRFKLFLRKFTEDITVDSKVNNTETYLLSFSSENLLTTISTKNLSPTRQKKNSRKFDDDDLEQQQNDDENENEKNIQEVRFVFQHKFEFGVFHNTTVTHDLVALVVDSASDDSLQRAMSFVENSSEQQVPIVVVDVEGGHSVDCEEAREDLVGQLMTFPEYSAFTMLPPPSAFPVDNSNNTSNYNNIDTNGMIITEQDNSSINLICRSCIDSATCPRHLLWDGNSLTEEARKAIRRSFWILDKDADGFLSDSEIVQFLHAAYGGRNLVEQSKNRSRGSSSSQQHSAARAGDSLGVSSSSRKNNNNSRSSSSPNRASSVESSTNNNNNTAASYSSDDILEVKGFVENIIERQIEAGADPVQARSALMSERDGAITLIGFFGLCHVITSEARHKLIWQMFACHGVEADGRPFRDEEIVEAVSFHQQQQQQDNKLQNNKLQNEENDENEKEEEENTSMKTQLHLSEEGAAFFASLYLTRPKQQPRDLFLFTPDCPWKTVFGLPNAEEENIPVIDFVQCWRFMAQVDPTTVAIFAKYWNYTGDELSDLFVRYPTRRFRNPICTVSESKMSPHSHQIRDEKENVSPANNNNNKKTKSKKKKKISPIKTNSPPPTGMFLVISAGGAGKTSMLMRCLHGADSDKSPSASPQKQQQQEQSVSAGNNMEIKTPIKNDNKNNNNDSNNTPFSPEPEKPSLSLTTPNNNNNKEKKKKMNHHQTVYTSGRSVALIPVRPNTHRRHEICVVMRELEDLEVDDVLADEEFMETVDGIILCYDGNDPYSFGFVAATLPKLKERNFQRLPVIVALLKADLPVEDQLGLQNGPEQICLEHNVPFPPMFLSAFGGDGSQQQQNNGINKKLPLSGLVNEIDSLPMVLGEIVLNPDVITDLCGKEFPNSQTIAGGRFAPNYSKMKNNNNKQQQKGNSSSASSSSSSWLSFSSIFKTVAVTAVVGVATYQTLSYFDQKYKISKYAPFLKKALQDVKTITITVSDKILKLTTGVKTTHENVKNQVADVANVASSHVDKVKSKIGSS